jgi:hypothetical protein
VFDLPGRARPIVPLATCLQLEASHNIHASTNSNTKPRTTTTTTNNQQPTTNNQQPTINDNNNNNNNNPDQTVSFGW